MAIKIASGSKGRFVYQPNIRAWKGGFYFESNPGLIMWAHRLPELLSYLRKNDENSIKVILSDAFQAEVFKNGWDLRKVICLAGDFFSVEDDKYDDLVPVVTKAIVSKQTVKAKKPVEIKVKQEIINDSEDEEATSENEEEINS